MRVVPILVSLLALASCGGDERPGTGAWTDDWERARALVPAASDFEGDAAEVCGAFLGEVRNQREELLPAPTEAVERAVTDWIEQAETVGLDCTEGSGDLERQLDDLERTADQIDRLVANQG